MALRHKMDTLRSIDAHMYRTLGPLYIQTEARTTARGTYPAEICIVKNPNDMPRVLGYLQNLNINSVYWHNGDRIF